MNIGIISNLYPPNERGGAELIASRVAHELAERGHAVSVLTTKPYAGIASLFPRLSEKHVERISRFAPFNVYGLLEDASKSIMQKLMWHALDLWTPFAKSVLHPWIVEEQPDVILTHNLKGIGLGLSRAIQREGIFHMHTLHDLQLTIPSGLLIWGKESSWIHRSFLRRWYEAFVRHAIGTPNIVISPSSFLLGAYHARGFFSDVQTQVLPNPAPQMKIPLRGDRGDGPLNILFAGQLETHKGILFLLDTLEHLDFPFSLHVAGDGALREMIAARCAHHPQWTFHGFVALDQLMQLISVVDAVVIPSLCYENSPTIMYESFAAGVPVIASRIGGIPELIEEGENGFLFEPGNACELIVILKKIGQDPNTFWQKTASIQAQAKKYALKNYVDVIEGFCQKDGSKRNT